MIQTLVRDISKLVTLCNCIDQLYRFFFLQDEDEERHEWTRSRRQWRRNFDPAPRRIDSCYLLRRNPGPLAVGAQRSDRSQHTLAAL